MFRNGWIFGALCLAVAATTLLARPSLAQSFSGGGVTATTVGDRPAAWVLVGNKIFFVEKDQTSILKVTASGAL